MPRSQQQLTSFNFGEVTPRVLGRHDADQYPMFCTLLENIYVQKHGGIRSRDGHHHVLKTKFDNRQVRLIPFIFSTADSYILEFGHRYVRFYRNQGFVENIEGVRSYLGDGTTTLFLYPEPTVLEANIQVSLNLVEQTVITDYTVAPADLVTNLIDGFDTPASWDENFDEGEGAAASPWVLGPGDVAVSPVGAEPRLQQGPINLPRGAEGDWTVNIDSFVLATSTQDDSSALDTSLGQDFATILSFLAAADKAEGTVDYSFQLTETAPQDWSANWNYDQKNPAPGSGEINHDNSGVIRINHQDSDTNDRSVLISESSAGDTIEINGQVYVINSIQPAGLYTDFTCTPTARQPSALYNVTFHRTVTCDVEWKAFHGNLEIDADNRIGFTGTELISVTGLAVTDIEENDEVRLEVRHTPNHALSNPILEGSVSSSIIALTTKDNADAQVHAKTVDAQGGEGVVDYTPEVGLWKIVADGVVQSPHPLDIIFYTDPGLQVTLSAPSIIQDNDGWVITFVTAPALSDLIVILDESSLPAATSGARTKHASGDISNKPALKPATSVLAVGDIFEIESPFEEDELTRLYFTQANDQMWLCHYKHKPWLLTRHNAYDWRFTLPTYTGAPWEDPAYEAIKGYPRVVTIFQERLWFAATLAKPQTLWGSRSADFFEFTVPSGVDPDPILPDSPVEYTVAARTHEAIEWMSSERVLVIGTSGTEHRLAPDDFIATDRLPTISKMSDYGGAHQIPVYVGDMTVFVHVSGVQLRSFKQREDTLIELYTSNDLGWMNDHLFENHPVKQPAYALVPDALLFGVRLDGQLVTGTYDPTTAQVEKRREFGWARHITDGKYESVAVIPVDFGDETWVAVEREVNGVTETHIEYMDKDNKLDGMLAYPAAGAEEPIPPVGSVSNLDHLEGRTVQVIADGALHPDRTVVGGSIDLNADTYTHVLVGESFRSKMVIAPYEGGNPSGTAQGKQKRWIQIWANLYDSANPIINGKRPPVREPSTPMNTIQPNRTGRVRTINLGFDRDGQITIEQDLPLDFNLLSIYGDYELGQG